MAHNSNGAGLWPRVEFVSIFIIRKASVEENSATITDEPETKPSIALYWHLLDHGRKQGNWAPPLATEIQGIG